MSHLVVVCVGCHGMVRSALAMQFVLCCSRLAAHTVNMTGKGMCVVRALWQRSCALRL